MRVDSTRWRGQYRDGKNVKYEETGLRHFRGVGGWGVKVSLTPERVERGVGFGIHPILLHGGTKKLVYSNVGTSSL